jgi:hypothetical protein
MVSVRKYQLRLKFSKMHPNDKNAYRESTILCIRRHREKWWPKRRSPGSTAVHVTSHPAEASERLTDRKA